MPQPSKWIDQILQNRVLTHVLYWLGIIFIYSAPPAYGSNNYEPLLNKLCYLPSQLIATYALIYYQIPRFLYKEKYFRFLGSFVLVAYATTVLARITKIYIYEPVLGADLPQDSLVDILTQITPLLGQYFFWVYLIPVITLLIKLVKAHFEERQKMAQLQREKTNAEIGYLKAQLHPHFLFNTLNNLYVLTLRKSKEAPAVVRKLSDMLAYMFQEGNAHEVPICRELALIQNYIDLELLRYGDRLDLVFEHEIDDPTIGMTPLVLLSIVENAFKHGASGDIGRPQINIRLEMKKQQLQFQVFNTKPDRVQADETRYKKGIGVSNIKRQLTLIYPGRHELEIRDGGKTYEVKLWIELLPAAEVKPATP